MKSPHREAQEIARDCLASRARQLDRTLARIYDRALRSSGVTPSQLGMLVAIELGGATTAAGLGRLLELEKSTVSRNLGRLVAAGLIATSEGLRVTARGWEAIRACHPLWREAQKKAQAALGTTRSSLLAGVPGPEVQAAGKAGTKD